jgi:succinate dehydrogenase / fumarate reductase cytochrome b subunit
LNQPSRPVFLNLVQIRLPIAGLMSILHRMSGMLLFLFIPFILYLLQLVLSGEAGYQQAADLFSNPVMILACFVLFWSLSHHFLAGIRYLLLDIHVGVDAPVHRYTAWLVSLLAPVMALLITGGVL